MPSDLTDNYIANTYKGVLHAGGEEIPANSKVQIYDGAGNATAIKLGENGIDCLSLSAHGLTANDLKYPDSPGGINYVMVQLTDNAGVDILGLRPIEEILCDDSNLGGATYKRVVNSNVPIVETKCGIVKNVTDVLITNTTAAAGGITTSDSGSKLITNIQTQGGIITALSLREVLPPVMKNLLLNAQGLVNQRQIDPQQTTDYTWNPGRFFLDRWRVVNSANSLAPNFQNVSGYNGNVKSITIPSGTSYVEQAVEVKNIIPGTHTLSWYGNATATVIQFTSHTNFTTIYNGDGTIINGELRYATFNLTGGAVVVRFSTAGKYFYLPKLERASSRTEFDFREFGAELALCHRYFCKTYPYSIKPQTSTQNGAIQHHGTEPINPVPHNLQWKFPAEQPSGNTAWALPPTPDASAGPNRFAVYGNFDDDPDHDKRIHTCTVTWSTTGVLQLRRTSGDKDLYPAYIMRLAAVHLVADSELYGRGIMNTNN